MADPLQLEAVYSVFCSGGEMNAALANLFSALNAEELEGFVKYEQGRASNLMRMAAKAQREASAGRKELKRRKRESKGKV